MSVGFYGKLPSHGDFISRAIGDAFIDRWDAWLQAGVAHSRRDLGDQWLELFLTSPVWRFALERGVIGGSAFAGILLPSVDRVGRYFPLTLVAELLPEANPHVVSVGAASWFDWIEAVARRALEQDLLDLDVLLGELRASEQMLMTDRLVTPPVALTSTYPGCAALWRFGGDAEADMGLFYSRLAAGLSGERLSPLALWWSVGSEQVAPSVLMTRGLPPAATFQDLLRNEWNSAWKSELQAIPAPRTPALALSCKSAAATDIGRERTENQDAFVERGSEGLWLVADGMGGHQSGGLASQLVAQHAMRAELSGDVAMMADSVAQSLQLANAQLRQRAAEEPGFDAGSTVVSLCVRGQAGIAQWAGDSRLYRLRQGDFVQLTRDHTVANEHGGIATEDDANVITRAVGGAAVLELDQIRFEVREGDRFLLCSDGLHGGMADEVLALELATPNFGAAAANLVNKALESGGHDNITAVVVAVES